jgi:hypothetical protein
MKNDLGLQVRENMNLVKEGNTVNLPEPSFTPKLTGFDDEKIMWVWSMVAMSNG